MVNRDYLTRTIDWRDLFGKFELERGKELVENEEYTDFDYGEGYATAVMESGSRKKGYTVSIHSAPMFYGDKWNARTFRCTCSHYSYSYRKKSPCEHKAALLFLWENKHGEWTFTESKDEHDRRVAREEQKELEEKRKELKKREGNVPAKPTELFRDVTETEETPFYDLTHILKKSKTNLYAVNRAKEMGDKNVDIEEIEISFTKEGEQVLNASANVFDGVKRYGVAMILSADRIITHHCGCRSPFDSYFYYRGFTGADTSLCEHELRFLQSLHEYLIKENPGDATNYAADCLLRSFTEAVEQQEEMEQTERRPDIELNPQLNQNDPSLTLSFTIGRKGEKRFILKKLADLVEAEERRGELTLGKSCRLNFAEECFTEESMPWFSFIKRKVSDVADANSQLYAKHRWGYVTTISANSKEELTGSSLDSFYALTEGTSVDYKHKTRKDIKSIRVGHTTPKIMLTAKEMRDAKKRITGVKVTGKLPVVLAGVSDNYFLYESGISKITEEEEQALLPLVNAVDGAGDISFQIGKRNLPEFYYRVLPSFLENPFIAYVDECHESIHDALPPEAEFRFVLDMREKPVDGIFCKATVRYEDRSYTMDDKELLYSGDYRDFRQETRVKEALQQVFDHYAKDSYYTDNDPDRMFYILTEGVTILSKFGEVLGGREFRLDMVRPAPKVSVGVSVGGDMMDISVLSTDLSEEELLDIFNSYRQKKKYFRLKGGDFVSLSDAESLAQADAVLNGLDIRAEDVILHGSKVPIYRALYLNRLLEEHDGLAADRDKTYRKLVKNFSTISDSDYEIPRNLKHVLRPYQEYGLKWLRTLYEAGFGGILADEMGLGKTLQSIALLEELRLERGYGKVLIVSPASLIYNWQEEFKRFAPDIQTCVVAGAAAERKKIMKKAEAEEDCVYITSYDLLRSDIARYEGLRFDCMVIDEAQYIKNQKAALTKAVKGIQSDHRFALTGTPIENKLAELWSIFDYLMPGYLFKYEEFQQKFETPIAKNKDAEKVNRLRHMVAPFLLRRLKADVLKDLPPKLEEVRYARFEDKQREIYDGQVVKMKHLISEVGDSGTDKIQIFAELMRIRQICCDPSLLLEDYKGGSAKRAACMELIESAMEGGHRMLVFSQFVSMLQILEEELKEKKIPYYMITGSTPKEKRIRMVRDFNDGDVPVFLISLKAGGTGLNLTGADVVIHYDPWWNLAVQNQATDRAHRIGQKNQVTVYKIIVKDTIEEKIMKLQESKKDLADAVLSGEESSLFSLSSDELLELLDPS